MARWHFTKRQYCIVGTVLSFFLLAFVIYRMLPPTQEDIDDCAVVVEQQAYYQLEVNGKPTVYFTDYKNSELVGGVIEKELTWLLGKCFSSLAQLLRSHRNKVG